MEQSLRKHRQTLVAPPGGVNVSPFADAPPPMPTDPKVSRQRSYGDLDAVAPLAAPTTRMGDLVKKRLSSRAPQLRVPPQDLSEAPSLPVGAQDLIREARSAAAGSGVAAIRRNRSRAASTNSRLEALSPERRRSGLADLDFALFSQPGFDAKEYISGHLRSSTDVDIAQFAERLNSMQNQLQDDKRDALYNNRRTFLQVGAEIASLTSEILTLRGLFNNLHVVTSAMRQDAEHTLGESKSVASGWSGLGVSNGSQHSLLQDPEPASSESSLKRSNSVRNSMLMLENIWAQEMGTLFRLVEGAQKFLPVVPGRHVVKESGSWYQLNAATWRPVQPVHLFVLNDHLLVATKRGVAPADNPNARARVPQTNGPSSGQRRLVADQCWALDSIDIIDLHRSAVEEMKAGSGGGSSNPALGSFCVRLGSASGNGTSFVYRADKPSVFTSLFGELIKIRHEHLHALAQGHQHRQGQHSRQASAHSVSSSHRQTSNTGSIKKNHSRTVSVDITGRSRQLREVDDVVNRIDLEMAYRNFGEAVKLITAQLRRLAETPVVVAPDRSDYSLVETESADELLKKRLKQQAQTLVDTLLHELAQPYIDRDTTLEYIRLLVQLDATSQARKTFLDARHELIKDRVKLVDFQGDVVSFVTQLAIIHFRMVLTTVELYRECFGVAQSSSALVEWARTEVENYLDVLSRQLYKMDQSSDTYKACMEVTSQQSALLRDIGLDLSFMLTFTM